MPLLQMARYWELLKRSTTLKLLILTFLTLLGILNFNSTTTHRFPKVYSNYSVLYTVITPPGVIVKPSSGTGNQLFRYACSFALSRKLRVPLYLQVSPAVAQNLLASGQDSSRDASLKSPKDRSFTLDKFHIPLDHLMTPHTIINASSSSILTFNDSFLLNLPNDNSTYKDKLLIHDDYCQSEMFFYDHRETIKSLLTPNLPVLSPPAVQWKLKIKSTFDRGHIPIGIHIRRGDFNGQKYWVTPISFYTTAMTYMTQKFPGKTLQFFVFSDDIQSIKSSLPHKVNGVSFDLHFVSGGIGLNATSNLEDLLLMTLLSHLIISNSTFSWWAAYLIPSPHKVIVAPTFHPKFFDHYSSPEKREFKRRVINKLWYPPEWIVLNPYAPKV